MRDRIDAIAPDVYVLTEEYGEWEDSRRRIDLLGIDKDANLVVIELKRSEDGGHMDLQAIRHRIPLNGKMNGAGGTHKTTGTTTLSLRQTL